MIRIRRGIVQAVRRRHAGLLEVAVTLDGTEARALAYEDLCGPVAPGDAVVLNTTAVTLGLGTGGLHFVIAVEGVSHGDEPPGRAMKLRYTPVQTAVAVVEETHREQLDALEHLDGMPVVVAGLHSALAPAAIAARAVSPDARVASITTEAGALPLALSETVPALKEAGLIESAITAGQAFGGDLEAVSVFGALAAARAVVGADLAVVAMGPGNLGTGSRWGFASIEIASIVDAVAAMGGRPIVVPRISFADQRERHRGVSHHTLTALGLALARAEVGLPPLAGDRAALVRRQLETLAASHTIVEVDLGEAERALRDPPALLESMGRGFAEDPDYFRTAAAAAVLAAR